MGNSLDKLTIRGFKSIRELNNFELKNLNVFVGANGAGKSNLLSFFKMLNMLMYGNLADYVRENGGISDILYNGKKHTAKMFFQMYFGPRGYRFTVNPTANDSAALSGEARFYDAGKTCWWELGDSNDTSSLLVKEAESKSNDSEYSKYVYDAIMSWKIYHFHDTSSTAPMRNWCNVEDNDALRSDASNIAPFLLRLREEGSVEYQDILNACQIVMPYLKDFLLKEQTYGKAGEIKKVNLSWRTKTSDFPMQTHHLSDGSIRFICLAAALLQPNPPSTLIIDEPELGLHPEAIHILSELINIAANRTQIIVAAQSPLLISQFEIDDIIIVNRKDGQSVFERLNKNDFDNWLENYSIGELWIKNVIQGGVCHE
ncbi:MAG: AAA family ATPase [Chitinispirillales bacterium]|jgi:predicted ATPase|nr:AAA family ATPase [Chitinispirillales bacterium]